VNIVSYPTQAVEMVLIKTIVPFASPYRGATNVTALANKKILCFQSQRGNFFSAKIHLV